MTVDAPPPPGEVLREESMVPLGLDAEGLAKVCGAERAAVAAIADERAGISGDMAIRFWRWSNCVMDVGCVRLYGAARGSMDNDGAS